VYAGGQLIAEYKNGTTYFVHGNHLGSSSILTSVAGGVVDCDAFYPFGEQDISICISSNSTSHKFTGDERDTETNLDHTWFRKYTSAQGRWMTPDPAGLAAVDPANPQSWNRYSYVLNDPLDFVDPLGLECGDAGWELVDVTGFIWSGEVWYPFSQPIWVQVKHKGCHDPQRTGGSHGGDGGGTPPNNATPPGAPKTPCEAATDEANQAIDNNNPTIGATTAKQGAPSLDWATISAMGYTFRTAAGGGAISPGAFFESAAIGALIKGSYYFGKGVVFQGIYATKVVLAHVKQNLACEGSPIHLPDFGSPPGSN
jgi:RHS repeat-associated protein